MKMIQMRTSKKYLKLLYRQLDGGENALSEKEKNALTDYLENSPKLQHEKTLIEAQRKLIAGTAAQSFGPFFQERVLQQIIALDGQPNGLDWQLFYDSLLSMFRKLAYAGALLSIALILLNPHITGSFSPDTVFSIPDLAFWDFMSIFH